MGLPDPVRTFWYAQCELGQRSTRTPWGIVATDRRFPRIWEANLGCVMEPTTDLRIEDIEAVLHPALREAGATHEHVEFWETSALTPAIEAARARAERRSPDVVMTLDAPPEGEWQDSVPDAVPDTVDVDIEEVRAPGPEFWRWLRGTLGEYGMVLADPVLDQLIERFRIVLVPAGLRWFVARRGRHRAGYAGLISLGGVGYVEGVVTMPGFRRQGVGRATVTAAIRASADAGDHPLFLLTDPHGDARRLYERLGFRVSAEVEGCTRPLPTPPSTS